MYRGPGRSCLAHSGHLSSRGLFLSCAAVHRHIAHVQGYRNAGMGGYREMPTIQIHDGRRRGRSCRDRRRRSVIKSPDNRPGGRYKNISIFTYQKKKFASPVFDNGTLSVHRESRLTVCRRLQVQTPFASFWNPDQNWYVLVCTGMHWYLLVCTGIY